METVIKTFDVPYCSNFECKEIWVAIKGSDDSSTVI